MQICISILFKHSSPIQEQRWNAESDPADLCGPGAAGGRGETENPRTVFRIEVNSLINNMVSQTSVNQQKLLGTRGSVWSFYRLFISYLLNLLI